MRADSQNLHSKPPNYFVTRIATLISLARNDGNGLSPKFYFILGKIFNLSLLAFFKYTDFLLENFNAFSKLARLDLNIPLPHILLPLAISFVTFQQIAFLFDCFKRAKGELSENLNIDFIDYALFISFFPQLIAGPIVHHREMMPQFSRLREGNSSLGASCGDLADFGVFADSSLALRPKSAKNSTTSTANTRIFNFKNTDSAVSQNLVKKFLTKFLLLFAFAKRRILSNPHDSNPPSKADSQNLGEESRTQSIINYEFLAKGIFIFSIGLFKKVFIADSFAKWANAGFGIVEKGGFLNLAESWATSLSYTFQLYFDFSGYCDMAFGLALMFGIVLPLNFDSPYKSLNISEFWRRWHITLGRFLRECLYIPLGGNRGKSNSSLTQSSREFEKSSLDGLKSYHRADFSAQPTNLAQDTRIANDLRKQSRITKLLTLRNLFIVAFLSGLWHGAGWGFIIWGGLHGSAMVIHRIYAWILERNSSLGASFALGGNFGEQQTQKSSFIPKISSKHKTSTANTRIFNLDSANRAKNTKLHFTQTRLYKCLCWLLTFNFVNLAWIFFRAENLNGAMNLIKGMFGIAWVELPQKWHRMPETLAQIGGRNDTIFYIVIAFIVCLTLKNSFEMLKNFDAQYLRFRFLPRIFSKKIYLKGGAVLTRFVLTIALFYTSIWILLKNMLDSNAYTPFLYFNF